MHCMANRYIMIVSKQLSHTSTKGFLQKKQVKHDEVDVSAGGKFDKSLRWSLSNAECKPNCKRDEHKETLNIKT